MGFFQLHPDKSNENTHKEFISVQNAYDVLGKPDSRLAYDSNYRSAPYSHPLNKTQKSRTYNPYGYPSQPNIKRLVLSWRTDTL